MQTELLFNEELIRDAISFELSQGGQVFVHNRVENIAEIAGIIQRTVPDARIAIGHGQMDGDRLEDVMLGFMEAEYDVLVATTIIESRLDISNANTIIINEAHHFGLSDLHQMRGRVGRSNKKHSVICWHHPKYYLPRKPKTPEGHCWFQRHGQRFSDCDARPWYSWCRQPAGRRTKRVY